MDTITATASWEEASRCPKCGNAGVEVNKTSGPERSTIYVLECQNKVCIWYSTTWIVQRLSDGTVPVRVPNERGRQKTFPTRPSYAKRQADIMMEQIDKEETVE